MMFQGQDVKGQDQSLRPKVNAGHYKAKAKEKNCP